MVSKNNRELLDDVIETELLNLSEMESGSEAKSSAIKDVAELYKLRIEEVKAQQARVDNRAEAETRQMQIKSQTIDRWFNFGAQVGLGICTLVMYNFWFHEGLGFEETGTIRSPWTRNIMSRMLPKIK